MYKRSYDSQRTDNTNSKRSRPEHGPGTKVVFVRALPNDCTENELLNLCIPYAVVEKTLIMTDKCQAFIQLATSEMANSLVSMYSSRDAIVRGKRVYFEYSNRQEVTDKKDSNRTSSNSSASAYIHRSSMNTSTMPMSSVAVSSVRSMRPPNKILSVTISDVQYDVTTDILQQVFQKFGTVRKAVLFNGKDNQLKALVEMENLEHATVAKNTLDGRDIYTGCNTLHVNFSSHKNFVVTYNNDKIRDFLNPKLPITGPPIDPRLYEEDDIVENTSSILANPPNPIDSYPPPIPPHGGVAPMYPPRPMNPAYMRGRVPPGAGYSLPPSRGGAYVGGGHQMLPPGGPGYAPRPPAPYNGNRSRSRERAPNVRHDGIDAAFGEPMRPYEETSPVLIVSGIPAELRSPDKLFTFLGCFGDVFRVKLMFRKQDTALVQFADVTHATACLKIIDKLFIFGQKLRVDYSKHKYVAMPRIEADSFEIENTKDYSEAKTHRYRKAGRNMYNMNPPCPTLHIYGLTNPEQINEGVLVDLFSKYGNVINYHEMGRDSRQALIEMEGTDQASAALIALDNYYFGDGHIRVSFSKSRNIVRSKGPPNY